LEVPEVHVEVVLVEDLVVDHVVVDMEVHVEEGLRHSDVVGVEEEAAVWLTSLLELVVVAAVVAAVAVAEAEGE
jgi:hypothetical protein